MSLGRSARGSCSSRPGWRCSQRLGVSVPGAEVRRLRCTNAAGRTLLDLSYDVIGAHGLGIHRGALFHALFDPL